MNPIFIVIAYTIALEEGQPPRPLYDDTTEKFIETIELANGYKEYLQQKYPNSLVALQELDILQTLDINSLKINDALEKLTTEEKELLNL